MLTKLRVRNFKKLGDVEVELGERVVLVGPNNSGKTSALQALALWSVGVRRWVERRGGGNVPRERAGVTINRRDLLATPVPTANLLWRDLRVREGAVEDGKRKTKNILIQIEVEGVDDGAVWTAPLEFDYANEESFYCRVPVGDDDRRAEIPAAASRLRFAYLPPMSGLAANETRLDAGAVDVRIGEGRTADVLRNLCLLAAEGNPEGWKGAVSRMRALFGVEIEEPQYVKERGEVSMTYRERDGRRFDLSASGRGQQQTLLLLAHMAANPGSVLLLDEPDAHLEILRQRQIYRLLTASAQESGCQLIVASHSEVVLNEAADRDVVVAFVGAPHRIDDRGGQVAKALKEIGFEDYLQAEQTGWVLYLEGATDLAVLQAFAATLDHPAAAALSSPFVRYVANQPPKAKDHFYSLREAKPDLLGVALYDRLVRAPSADPHLRQEMWRRREIENYLCRMDVLEAFAFEQGRRLQGDLFAAGWREAMREVVAKIVAAMAELGSPDPWGPDCKATDDFLDRVFLRFYERLGLPNLMRKSDYHELARFVPVDALDPEVREKLDAVAAVAAAARAR